MKEEPRYLQKQYESQTDNTLYDEAQEKSREVRQLGEKNLEVMRRTTKGGMVGRKITGVKVISGNPDAVFSTTRADDARMKNRPQGVPGVNEEASKLGSPMSPGKDVPWQMTSGSETTHEGEQ